MPIWSNKSPAITNATPVTPVTSSAPTALTPSLTYDQIHAALQVQNPLVFRDPGQRAEINSAHRRRAMIGMRLRLAEGEPFPFEALETHETDEQVFVFVVQKKEWVVLEDDIGLFPSDTLITQLRLIAK